jgi:hypothetical protein
VDWMLEGRQGGGGEDRGQIWGSGAGDNDGLRPTTPSHRPMSGMGSNRRPSSSSGYMQQQWGPQETAAATRGGGDRRQGLQQAAVTSSRQQQPAGRSSSVPRGSGAGGSRSSPGETINLIR